MVGEGGVDPSLDRVEVEQLGIESGRERLFAGRLGEAPAGLVDRGDPCGGSEQGRQDDLGGDLADGAEPQVRLAEVDGEAIDLSGCQGVGELVHSSLRAGWSSHKASSEKCLSSPSPATLTTDLFGKY